MNSATGIMLTIVTVGTVLSGCAKQAAPSRPSDPAPATQPAPAKSPVEYLSAPPPSEPGHQADIVQAQALVALYFNAVVNNDGDFIDQVWETDLPRKVANPDKAGRNWTKTVAITELKLEWIGMESGRLTAKFTVTADLGPNPGGAWGPGPNTRWAALHKNADGVWKIHAMASSPHVWVKN